MLLRLQPWQHPMRLRRGGVRQRKEAGREEEGEKGRFVASAISATPGEEVGIGYHMQAWRGMASCPEHPVHHVVHRMHNK
eukprot:scaffold89014_cov18-Tisochrysis_lutea.AAC.1